MAKTASVQKLITFPSGLYERLESKAGGYGMLVTEYIRYLALKNVERDQVEYISEDDRDEIREVIADYKEGNYIEVDPFNKKALKKALE